MPAKPKKKYVKTPLGKRLPPPYSKPFTPMTPEHYNLWAARDAALKGR